MKKRILIIEDEQGIAETIIYALSTEGFDTIHVITGNSALEEVNNSYFDLLILDIGLPDINGFDLLKEIRKNHDIPIIILTARSDEIDKIIGLELGADDYVVKPFSPRELTARVKANLRRSINHYPENNSEKEYAFNVNSAKRQIFYFGEKLEFTRYEYEILNLFIQRPGWVFSRDKIMELIWTEPEESFDRTVDAHIKTIRAKLKKINPELDPIITHRGIGYALMENL